MTFAKLTTYTNNVIYINVEKIAALLSADDGVTNVFMSGNEEDYFSVKETKEEVFSCINKSNICLSITTPIKGSK